MTLPVDPTTPLGGSIVQKGSELLQEVPGAEAIGGITDSIVATRRWIGDRHNWTRVAWFVGGMGLVYIGVVMLVRKPLMAVAKTTADTVTGTAKALPI